MKAVVEFSNGINGYDYQEYLIIPEDMSAKEVCDFLAVSLRKYADNTYFAGEEIGRTKEEHFEECSYHLTFANGEIDDEGFISIKDLRES